MKISTESLENREAVLNIEVEPAEMEESLNRAYHDLVKKVRVPGFRKGKVPRPVLERYIGKEELQREALEDLIPNLCSQAVEEQKLEIIARPEVEVVQLDPAIIKATFALRPEVELGDYRSISVALDVKEITEEQVDNVIEQIRDRNAIWNPVDRAVSYGDLTVIEIEERKDGETVNSYPAQQYPVVEGSYMPLPDFAEQLVGMAKGEEKEFTLAYPEDYPIKDLANQQYDFKVTINEVKEKSLPEADDDFAKSLGEDYESIAALRTSILENLKNITENAEKQAFEQKVIDEAVSQSKVEFPSIMVEHELERFMGERERMMGGHEGLENYLKNINKTEEDMKEEIRPDAVNRVTQSLVLGKVAEVEKIEVTAAEIDTEIEGIVNSAGEDTENARIVLNTEQGRNWVEEKLMIQKTMKCLTDIAIGNAAKNTAGNSTENTDEATTEVTAEAASEEKE